MLTSEQNELLCRTDPGTPGGEFMRRYWQPVALSKEVTPGGKPKQVRIMGEDLVLFRADTLGRPDSSGRDDAGRPGLLGLHCSHRLTSLAYGRVEDGGLRCPFHGWLYDVDGRCLDQPAETDDTFKDRVQHPSYPCEELGGLVFAYFGPPETRPLLPRYEVLVREDGTRKADFYPINSNYLQNVEGALDTAHFSYLHMDHWSQVKSKLSQMPKPVIEYEDADYGIWQKSWLPNVQVGILNLVYTYYFFPAGFMRVQGSSDGGDDIKKFMSWYVPVDDTHTLRFQVAFAPFSTHRTPYEWPEEVEFRAPGPENDYFRDYERADTISGIPVNAPGTATKGYLSQDSMVNETQGTIVERSLERLGVHDHVVTAMRLMMLKAIHDVQQGRDPKHIIRDPAENAIVYIRGAEALEAV
jgi:phenylpropionate dioxygenase-like ring-hydroxylating dioxygenase large terminal subunit